MIITKQKDMEKILSSIDNKSVFIAGCNECATLCHTGGEEEVIAMKKALEGRNIEVTGHVVLEPACHFLNDKRIFRKHKEELDKAKKILVLACGNGVQTVSEIIQNAEVISGTDTLFLGEIKHANEFEKRCNLCGECVLEDFAGLCPVTRCPKGMLNGPCGGSKNGKCEINPNLECVWNAIYERLKEKGKLSQLKKIYEPKDWSKSLETRRII